MNKNLSIKFSQRRPNVAQVNAGHHLIRINRRFDKHYIYYRFTFLMIQPKGRAPLPFGSGDFRLPIKNGDTALRHASKYIASTLNSTNYQKYLKAVNNLVVKNRKLKATLQKAEAQLQAHGYQKPVKATPKNPFKDATRQKPIYEVTKH